VCEAAARLADALGACRRLDEAAREAARAAQNDPLADAFSKSAHEVRERLTEAVCRVPDAWWAIALVAAAAEPGRLREQLDAALSAGAGRKGGAR
jgi:hypothetical protein